MNLYFQKNNVDVTLFSQLVYSVYGDLCNFVGIISGKITDGNVGKRFFVTLDMPRN